MTTFTADKPAGSDTIAASDDIIKNNFSVIKDHFAIDHVWSSTEAGTYGVHNSTLFKKFVGYTTRVLNAGAGAVAVTGVGFQPQVILFFAIATGAHMEQIYSIGGYDSTNHASIQGVYDLAATNKFYPGASATYCILLSDDFVYATYQRAVVSATGADGFTLTWSTTGMTSTNEAAIFYVCLRFSV